MTRREQALLNTARSTHFCLEKHHREWERIPAFAEQWGRIRTRFEELDLVAGEGKEARFGQAWQRQKARDALVEDAWVVAGQVQAWAAVEGEEEIRREACVTRRELAELPGGLSARGLRIHQLALECQRRGGTEFGVTAERLVQLAQRIQAVKVLETPLADAHAGDDGADGELEGGLEQLLELLREVTDPLMRRFHREESAFFQEYQVARRLVDPLTGLVVDESSDADWWEEESTPREDSPPRVQPETAAPGTRVPAEEAALSS